MLMLMAQELKNPWKQAAVNPAPSVLALFEVNPFGSFDEMFLEQKLEWEPFDRKKLLDDLTNNPKSRFDVRGRTPFSFQGSIWRQPLTITVTFRIKPDYLSTPGSLERVAAYLAPW